MWTKQFADFWLHQCVGLPWFNMVHSWIEIYHNTYITKYINLYGNSDKCSLGWEWSIGSSSRSFFFSCLQSAGRQTNFPCDRNPSSPPGDSKNGKSARKSWEGHLHMNDFILGGGIPTPLKNMSSSVGMIIPNWMKTNNHVPNHQLAYDFPLL